MEHISTGINLGSFTLRNIGAFLKEGPYQRTKG